jgi:tRNA dimethylallyltransferase
VVLLGPTASGKTQWGLELAKKFNGEIISSDSRQLYKKMDIGTAKDPGEWKKHEDGRAYFIGGVPHYLIDFLDPGNNFTVAEFKDEAEKMIHKITARGKVPFLVGGTGLYISAVVDNWLIPRQAPHKKLRKSLEQKRPSELSLLLKSMDPAAAGRIDGQNKRRLIRALEVCILTGEPFSTQRRKGDQQFDCLQIGIENARELLYQRINDRVEAMVEKGLAKEVERLLSQQYSWELPSMSGIGYRQFKEYFEGKISLEEAKNTLKRDTKHFAKRQMTWFRRDKRIKWVKTLAEAENLIKEFLL